MTNPHTITQLKESLRGKATYSVKENGSLIFQGNGNALKDFQIQLLWKMVTDQYDEIVKLNKQVEHLQTHLVLLEPIDQPPSGEKH